MLRKSGIFTVVFAFALTMLLSVANAAIETVDLKGSFWSKAKGNAVIQDVEEGKKEITVEASGLKPNSVYTLWFLSEERKEDMAGVGTGDYSFKSDAQGNASYRAVVPEDELRKWEKFEVAYHPDGNPRNLKDHKTALKGDIKEAREEGKAMEERKGR